MLLVGPLLGALGLLACYALASRVVGPRAAFATAVPDVVLKRAPGATIVGHEVISDDDEPERVFDRAPRRNKAIPVEIWLLQVPANGS